MSATRDVVVRFLGNSSGLNNAAGQGGAAVGKFSAKTQKMATVGLAAVGAFGAGMVSMLKGGVAGLKEGEEAEAGFAQALRKVPKAVGISSAAVKANAEAIQSHTRFSYEDALGVGAMLAANDGVQSALKAGVTSIEDATAVTLDLATAQKIDGTAAAKLLAKWMAAPEKAAAGLLKAGVRLTASEKDKVKAWVKGGDTAKAQGLILDKLKAKTEGAAKAAGETTEGQLIRAKAAWGEVQESLATKVMPAITNLMGWLLKVAKWAQENPGKVKLVVAVLGALAIVLGTISFAIKAWAAWTKIATAAQWLWNAALNANPISLIVIALGLLVGAFVLAYRKSETFRNVVDTAMRAIRNITIDVIQFVVDKFLWYAETILWAASKAFGWVPGLGGKLKKAHEAIKKFRDDTNATLEGLKDHDVKIVLDTRIGGQTVGEARLTGSRLAGARAGGGPVLGGRSYLVGERGPELFTPRGSGSITANGAGVPEIHVYLGDRELRDVVRVEVRESNRATRTKALAGRRN